MLGDDKLFSFYIRSIYFLFQVVELEESLGININKSDVFIS